MSGFTWKLCKLLLISGFLFLSLLLCGGCIAKSAAVDANKALILDVSQSVGIHAKQIVRIFEVLEKAFPEEKVGKNKDIAIQLAKEMKLIVQDAVDNKLKSSALVSADDVKKIVTTATAGAGKVFGLDLEWLVSGALALFGGSKGLGAMAARRRKKNGVLADLDPETANKVKDII